MNAPRTELRPGVEADLELGLRLVEGRLDDWTRCDVGFLQEGARTLVKAGGKRFRPTLCLLSYLAAGGRPFRAEVLDGAALLELVHTATLVHDDILDESDTRRGRPTAHKTYGIHRAILLGDHLFGTALGALPRFDAPIQRSMLHATRLLAEGEALEIELTAQGKSSLEDYFIVIAKKTASLVEASTYAGAYLADPALAESFAEFGFHAGIAFQLVDDLLDVEGVTEITGKPTQWDLSRGVPNAAVLATLEADLRGKPAALRLPRGAQAEMDALLQRMAETGGDERVRRLARMYAARALEALDQVPASAARAFLAGQVESSLTRIA